MRRILIACFLLICFCSLTELSFRSLKALNRNLRTKSDQAREVLYLPQGRGLEFMSFGYRTVLANLMWFKTISYFGKHYATDRDYRWLYHMCDLITTLNPQLLHVFEFAGMMLAWETGDYQKSLSVLSKGINYHPDYWKLYYLRGFTYMYFQHDRIKAARDFMRASRLPGAHPMLARLAAKNLSSAGINLESVAAFLLDMIHRAQTNSAKKALTERLDEVKRDIGIRDLNRAVVVYRSKYGSIPNALTDLVEAGIIGPLGSDPLGGNYFLDPKTGEVSSTSIKNKR